MRYLRSILAFLERHIIALGVVTAICIAMAYAPVWHVGQPTYEAAYIWVSAVVAAGTLGTVGAALRTAREAADRERKVRMETSEELERIRCENREREDQIRVDNFDREERFRHDNVRPVIGVSALWGIDEKNKDTDGSDLGILKLRLTNGGAGNAVNVSMLCGARSFG